MKAYAEAEDTARALAVVASVGGRRLAAEAMSGGSERCREEVSVARRRGGVGSDARGKWTREDLG